MQLSTAPRPLSEPAWTTNRRLLQEKVYSILVKILDPEHINLLLNDEALSKYWEPTFTHKSVNADRSKNYEAFEFYGDPAMKLTFAEHLRKRFGDKIDPAIGTLLMNKYMSKDYQAGLAEQLGLTEFIRFDPQNLDPNINVKEDVLEAFFGCLKILADDRIHPGIGYVYCLNLMNRIFNNVTIELEDIQKDPITLLKERFEKLGWEVPQKLSLNSDKPHLGEVKCEIKNGDTGELLGVGYGTKAKAEAEASRNALKKIEEKGYTLEYADESKLDRLRNRSSEFDKQHRRVDAAIVKLNELVQKSGKSGEITRFKIESGGTQRVSGGQRYTFVVKVAYKNTNGTIDWRVFDQETGDDQDTTRTQLLKKIADKFNIP